MNAEYVGHPFFDEREEKKLDEDFLNAERTNPHRLVAILPGSRTQEVTRNLPIMIQAARKLAATHPNIRFAIACLHDRHKALAQEILDKEGVALPIELHAGKTAEIIHLAECAWSVSGSVSLELMMECLPTAILYKLNRLDLLIARPFIKSRFITLVNLLAGEEVMPEYLTTVDVSDELAGWASRWLDQPEERAKARQALADVRAKVAIPGAADRAAERIIALLAGARGPTLAGPHTRPSNPSAHQTPSVRG
jgi:lipid-A-disaccharide synthase